MIRAALLDLVGVVYQGERPLPGAVEAVAGLREAGLRLRFLTNTTRMPRRALLSRLSEMGIVVAEEELFTPAQAARTWLKTKRLSPHLLIHPDLEEDFANLDGSAGEACRTATADWQDTLTISQFFARGLAELQSFYDSKPSGAALEEGRQRAFAEMRESFRALKLHPGRNADFAAGPINNASLIQERIYLKDLDVFDRLYHQAGGLRRAVEEIREAVDKGGEPFARVREAAATGASPAARTSGGLTGY